ncbi:MAG: flagellar hook-associated protein FlgK [Firmicutes bacterium]|nr:flagellar hook-associated protein FlgK [Bacillota bacterium]
MRSTFFGLEIGYRGLVSHQKALDITGHNVANASTPGYSRQRGEITATDPFTYPAFNKPHTAGQIGTGVEITAVLRIRDQLIDNQIQYETMMSGYWEARRDILDEAEMVLNEPADSNIRTSVDQFWQAFQNFSNDPSSIPARSELRQKTLAMCAAIRDDYARELSLRHEVNQRITDQVADINRIGVQLAELNDQIGKVTAMGDRPNDLMDKRDALIEELSKMVNINHFTDSLNRMTVTIKGVPLVEGLLANQILAVPNWNDPGMVQLEWKLPSGQPVEATSGRLKGWLEMRDEEIPLLLSRLNDFAGTLITRVNALHQTGYGLDSSTGWNFFDGTGANDIDLSNALKDETNGLVRIAGSDDIFGLPGNNKTALAICELKHLKILTAGTATMGDFIGALINDLGEKSLIAGSKAEHQTVLINNLDQRRESICGVSMDEEMTNMVKFQHGYNAAAKIITTMDEMLDVVVNRLKV